MVENKKAKAGKRRNDSGSSEEDMEEFNSNNCGISFWIVFNLPEYGISSFAEHISRHFVFIVNTVTSVVCSIAI